MIVMAAAGRAAGRKTVRPVSFEYSSTIWSGGALKNLRKCSALSASPGTAGLSAVVGAAGPAAGLPGAGGASCPATLAAGLALGAPAGAMFVAPPGRGNAGRAAMFGSGWRFAPSRLVAALGTFVPAELVAPGTRLVA